MSPDPDIILRLTDPALLPSQRRPALHQFALANGWRPSDEVEEYYDTATIANGHLIVEHGLANTAVITFLKATHPFAQLPRLDQLRLLSFSYNHLVDWHLFPSLNGLTSLYNRTDPPKPIFIPVERQPDCWRAEAFERLLAERPTPNLRALDDALIATISAWKRVLGAELGQALSREQISSLFNSLILVRALEDHRRRQQPNAGRILPETWSTSPTPPTSLRSCLLLALRALEVPDPPQSLLDASTLAVFDSLDRGTVNNLLLDFYTNRFAQQYPYDFSLISKHALSRIYEHYISMLKESDSKQASFFSDLPDEIANRELGGIYTPHYIARFFARFLKENLTPPLFRSLKLADPACGSGIFLRTTLEMQCDPLQDIDIHAVAGQAFQNVLGIDVEETACQATRLSLSLLHLVLTGSFPSALRIESAEVIEYYAKHLGLKEAYDAVVTNPPFIKWDAVPEDWRQRISKFMATEATGKIDLFLALLKVGLEMVKPGGFLLYVLPHSFLIARNAAKLRQRIAAEFWVRVIVDLSEIPVFGDVGAYVVLLILQKKPRHAAEEPLAAVVHCRGYVGFALQSALEGKRTTSDFYSIHDTSQATFRAKTWQVPPPSQQGLAAALRRFTRLDDFLIVREGFVTGADDVFIRRRADAPPGEEKAYRPFLHDREMGRYRVPKNTKEVVFYPFENDRRLEATEVRKRFPATWAFLGEHKKLLQERASVRAKTVEWWCPERPRSPENMLRPKLVSPHLILLPRFSFDETGQYAISHSPLLYPRDPSSQTDFLLYFLAVLNSSVAYWQIAMLSHKYSRGYAMLEPKTLKELRIPPPAEVHPSRMKRLLALVRRRLDNSDAQDLELDIDRVVADLYGLSTTDRIEIGMER